MDPYQYRNFFYINKEQLDWLRTSIYQLRAFIFIVGVIAIPALISGIYAVSHRGGSNTTEIISFRCTDDSECQNVSEVLSCSQSFCNLTSEQCSLRLLPTSECEDNSNCVGLEECKGCQCVLPILPNVTIGCVMDSQCINLTETNPCITGMCDIMTMECISRYSDPSFDCNGDDSLCDPGEVCQGCQCVDLCDGVTCTSNACQTSECNSKTGTCVVTSVVENCCVDSLSCPTQDFNTCLEYQCGTNSTCDLVKIMGATCAYDEDCADNEACEACTCVPDPPITEFSDAEFALFSESNDTTTAMFSLDGVTMGTKIILGVPDQNGTLLTDVDIFESGIQTSAFVSAPVAGQSITYSISRFRVLVNLHIQGIVAGTSTTGDPFTTGVIIPVGSRPVFQIETPLVVVNNGGNELGRCIVRTTGEITIFSGIVTSGFTGLSGYRGFTVSWQTN